MKTKSGKKTSVGDIIFNTFNIVILVLYSIFIIFLLVWGFNTSLKSSDDFGLFGNVVGFPDPEWSSSELLFGNYLTALSKFKVSASTIYYVGSIEVKHATESGMVLMLVNTLIYVLIGAFLPTLTCYLTSYLCAKFKFKFSKFVFAFAVFMMSVPTVATQPSEITLLRNIGVYDTYFCHVFQKLNYGGMYFFVFFAFFEMLPDAYVEAAEIDGASQLRIFLSIIIPLGAKMIGSVALINGVQFWNDYQAPLLYTPTLPTLAYGVYYLVNGAGNAELKNVPTTIACCMMLAIPLIIVFIAFRNKLMGNMSMGGLKG